MEKLFQTLRAPDEKEIISKILNGELALFEVLIRRCNPVLYKIARSYGFNHQDAEDLMQETHVTAYMQLQNFQFRSAYKTWLSKIMVNKCLYKLSYGYRKNEVPDSDTVAQKENPLFAQQAPNGEKSVLRKELARVLEESLQHLPQHYRTVFVLREIEGFNVAETAELLSITPINVKVRLSRAKVMLQQQLEQIYSATDLYEFNLRYCDALVQRVFDQIAAITKS